MKTLLTFCAVIFVTITAFAQTPLWVCIETNGDFGQLCIQNQNGGGRWNFGSYSNFTTVTNAIVFRLNAAGNDTNGSPITFRRHVISTRDLRWPYNVNGQTAGNFVGQRITNGSDIVLRFALSRPVYNCDASVTADVPSNLYSNNTSAVAIPFTNYSALVPQKPVGNWTRPPFQSFTNGIAQLGLFAVGPGANNGLPVACVEFWAEDEAGTKTTTNRVVRPVVNFDDYARLDRTPAIEYMSGLDVTALAKTNLCKMHVRVIPVLGTNILDSSTTGFTYNQQSMELCETWFFNDEDNDHGGSVAIVDPTNGTNSTGQAVSKYAFSTAAPPRPFNDSASAYTAIARTNQILFGRSDVGGSIIYLTNGNYRSFGGTNGTTRTTTNNSVTKTWLTVASYPGLLRENIVITNAGGSKELGDHLMISNLMISSVAAPTTFSKGSNFWAERCLFTNVTDTRCIDQMTNVFFSHNDVYTLPQGLKVGTTGKSDWKLTRGNYISNSVAMQYVAGMFIGNHRAGWSGTNFNYDSTDPAVTLRSPASYPIIAFNRLEAIRVGTGDIIELFNPTDDCKNTNGLAIIQNVVENVRSDLEAANPARVLSICSSATAAPDTNDVNGAFVEQNDFFGQRCNLGENAGGNATNAVAAVRKNWTVLNNLMDQPNTKTDLHYTPSGLRTNWNISYGVGWSGNTDYEPLEMDTGGWHWEYFGVNSYYAFHTQPHATVRTNQQLWDRQASLPDGTAYTGNGDNRLLSTSPMRNLATNDFVLPYDITGRPRGRFDPPGAYSTSSPRRGDF